MRENIVIGDALCLMRFLPLLDVLESPVRQSVDDVIRGCLGSGEITDSVLISLDEFCEAVGTLQDFDRPAFFEQSVAGLALVAVGAGQAHTYSANARVSEQAVVVWSALTRLPNDQMQVLTPPVIADFAERERSAQREDERALASRERDPMAVIQRADQLALASSAMTAELSKVATVLGWRPSGPCGLHCTWPVCESSAAANCVRRRTFQRQQTLAARLRRRHGAESRPWYLIANDLLAESDDQPFEFVTEVGVDGYELRKVAQYMDGRLVCVDREHRKRGGVELSSEPVPSWPELEKNKDLRIEEVPAEFCEQRWKQGLTASSGSDL
ncbi:DUF6881 domain-containing protein [Streptomyces sp. NPDC001070]